MRDLFQDRPLAPRAGARTAPSPLRRAAERDEALALFAGAAGGLEMSLERWLDRMEGVR